MPASPSTPIVTLDVSDEERAWRQLGWDPDQMSRATSEEDSSILPQPPVIAKATASPTRAQRKVLAEACRAAFDEMRGKFQPKASAASAPQTPPDSPPQSPIRSKEVSTSQDEEENVEHSSQVTPPRRTPATRRTAIGAAGEGTGGKGKSSAVKVAVPMATPVTPAREDREEGPLAPSQTKATPPPRSKQSRAAAAAAPQQGAQSPARLVHTMSARKISARKWTSKQVTAWLELLGLGQYSYHFAANGVDGHTLFELSREHVKDGLGIQDQRHLISLEYGMLDLAERRFDGDLEADWEWSCANVGLWLESRGLGCLKQRFADSAVHGGVLFRLTKEQFVSLLGVGPDPLIIMSLMASVDRARVVGSRPAGSKEEAVPDWGSERVGQWLESIGLGHLDPAFRQHAVNGSILLQLTPTLMKGTLGLTEIQTLVVQRAIAKLARKHNRHARTSYKAWKSMAAFTAAIGKRLRGINKLQVVKTAQTTAPSAPSTTRRVLKLSDLPAPAPLPGPPRRRGSSQSFVGVARRPSGASSRVPAVSPKASDGDWFKDVSSNSALERSLVSS